MNKNELYKIAVDLRRKTGQGLPGFIRSNIDSQVIDELIKDGKFKSITKRMSYLPDDEFLCIVGGYCVEEDYINGDDFKTLHFVRYYVGLGEETICNTEYTINDIVEKYKEEYEKWLEKNKDDLELMLSMGYE